MFESNESNESDDLNWRMGTTKVDYRTISIGEIRRNGGLESRKLRGVYNIDLYDYTRCDKCNHDYKTIIKLTDEEKNQLCNSEKIIEIYGLDLRDQNIDDDFVEKLSNNPSDGLKCLMNINLSENPKITNESLNHILNSPYLGSIRNRPAVSGKYGTCYTKIDVKAQNTMIKKNIELESFFSKLGDGMGDLPVGFTIKYRNGDWDSNDGIKIIECNDI